MKSILTSLVLAIILLPVNAVLRASDTTTHAAWKIGEIDFYSLQDKPGEMANALFGTDEEIARLVPTGKSPSSYNVFLIKKGNRIILIDTGAGGAMIGTLAEIGVQPEDVDAVLLTHTHGDHVGGLLKADGTAVFPNASLWLEPRELAFWNETYQPHAAKCQKAYGEPKMITADEKTSLLIPELTAFDLAGHTPGHTGFLITVDKVTVAVVGDLLHSGAIQFSRPDLNARFDRDSKTASELRRQTMKLATENGWLFVTSHLPFPGVGKIEVNGDAFRFVPADAVR